MLFCLLGRECIAHPWMLLLADSFDFGTADGVAFPFFLATPSPAEFRPASLIGQVV